MYYANVGVERVATTLTVYLKQKRFVRTDRGRMSGNCAGSFLFGLALMASASSPAAAFNKIDLPGTRTKDYIKDLCRTVKGSYQEGQGQYGCMTNCGQQGLTSDACGINCSEKTNKCYGWSPSINSQTPPKEVLNPPAGSGKSGK